MKAPSGDQVVEGSLIFTRWALTAGPQTLKSWAFSAQPKHSPVHCAELTSQPHGLCKQRLELTLTGTRVGGYGGRTADRVRMGKHAGAEREAPARGPGS